jgi:hypothetical protein
MTTEDHVRAWEAEFEQMDRVTRRDRRWIAVLLAVAVALVVLGVAVPLPGPQQCARWAVSHTPGRPHLACVPPQARP